MAIMGHRSKDGVRTYTCKEISHDQQEKMNNMIQPTKKLKMSTAIQNVSCQQSVSFLLPILPIAL